MPSGRKAVKVHIDGKRLAGILKKRHYTQSKLAMKIGTVRETVSRSIRSSSMDPILLEEACKVLDVSPDYIKGDSNIKIDGLFKNSADKKLAEEAKSSFEVDEDGYIIDSYSDSQAEKIVSSCDKAFITWALQTLKARKDFDTYLDNDDAPGNISTMLSCLNHIGLRILQDELLRYMYKWTLGEDIPTDVEDFLRATGQFEWEELIALAKHNKA